MKRVYRVEQHAVRHDKFGNPTGIILEFYRLGRGTDARGIYEGRKFVQSQHEADRIKAQYERS